MIQTPEFKGPMAETALVGKLLLSVLSGMARDPDNYGKGTAFLNNKDRV